MSITMSMSLFFVLYFNVKLFHTTNVKTLYLYPHSTWSVSGAGIRTFKRPQDQRSFAVIGHMKFMECFSLLYDELSFKFIWKLCKTYYFFEILVSYIGVFGAGKSFLLAVVIIYLVELFKASDALNQHRWDQFNKYIFLWKQEWLNRYTASIPCQTLSLDLSSCILRT